ncbi:MAG: hypothetical protein GKR94_22260 [Gammaproteobacteria bacterium]|nr:hypothetical protein [Gammaproteobacteria bacterium]
MSPAQERKEAHALTAARHEWRRAMRGVARRLRARRAGQACGVAGVALIGVICAVAAWMDAERYHVLSVQAGREVVIVCTAAAAVFLLWTVLRRASMRWLTAQMECEDRALDGLMVSAVELDEGQLDRSGPAGDTSSALSAVIFTQAKERLQSGQGWLAMEQRRRRQAGFVLLAPVALVALLAATAPEWLERGIALIANGAPAIAAHNPYSLRVTPGDVELPEGSDLRVTAHAIGFAAPTMTLRVRHPGGGAWRNMTMVAAQESEAGAALLTSLARDMQYQVTSEGVVSAVHTVKVIPRPGVEAIALEYHYPEHTGAAPLTVPDGGDIRAIKGTRVIVRVKADAPVASGRLRLAAGVPVALKEVDGEWIGELMLEADDTYRVEFASAIGGVLQAASREYAITALADGLPRVAIAAPGRDAKVSPIEEVTIRVDASDDVAVRDLQLLVSVNGAPERSLGLPGEAVAERAGAHTLMLEDMALNPGDLIAFHAIAKDSRQVERQVQTDIYFLEVRPFERFYRRARAGGGRGGGDNGAMLAAQQRALVIALFKLVRDRAAMAEEQFSETVGTLGRAQARIRDRVAAIARRIAQRSVIDSEPGFKKMAEELPHAIAAMVAVESFLAAADAGEALPEARTALLHLQRADAVFRDVRIAQSQRGGSGRAGANDLANLFKLEMDRLKSQYANVERGQGGSREQDIDETMRKLQELAQRQRRNVGELGSASAQRALADELEALLRELERLTRKKPDAALERAKQELREAATAMRQASNSAQASADRRSGQGRQSDQGRSRQSSSGRGRPEQEQAGRDGGQSEGAAAGQQSVADSAAARRRRLERALASLEAARRALEQRGPVRLAAEVAKAHQLAQSLNAEQAAAREALVALKDKGPKDRGLKEKVPKEKGPEEKGAEDNERGALFERKTGMARAAQRLAQTVDSAIRSAQRHRQSQPVAQSLREVARGMREGALTPALRRSGEKIAAGELDGEFERIEEQIGRVTAATEDALAQAVAQARALVAGSGDDARRRLTVATQRLARLAERMQAGSQGPNDRNSTDRNSARTGAGESRAQGRQGAGMRPGAAGGTEQRLAAGAGAVGRDDAGGLRGSAVARLGGGSYGGLERRSHSNADIETLRDGLRLSAAALREVDSVVPPTARGAQDISTLVARLEALIKAEAADVDRIAAAARDLQRVERALRGGNTQHPAIASIRQGAEAQAVEPRGYRRLVGEYYRQLGEVR